MRLLSLAAVTAAIALLSTTPAAAGTRLLEVDDYAAAGKTLTARIEVTNDTGEAGKFKVYVRVKGDPEKAVGKAAKKKGKKRKFAVRLEAGETIEREIALDVPDGAVGPILVECKVKGPNGREQIEKPSYGMPADWKNGEPGRPPVEGPAKPITVEGKIVLRDWERPGDDEPTFSAFAPFTLEIEDGDGKVWGLFGPEADYLALLMRKAELTSTTGRVTGIPMGILTFEKAGRGDENAILVLEWEARGIEDPRARLVPFWPIFSERTSKITEAKEVVVTDEEGWERLLASAGIRFPEVPQFEKQFDLPPGSPVEVGMVGVGGMAPWDIDFDRLTVVGIFAGEKRSTGYRVRVVSVMKEDDGGLLVTWTLDEPSEYEVVIEVPTRPFAIAAVVATGKRISFEYTDAPTDPVFPPWEDPWVPFYGGAEEAPKAR